MKTVLGGTFDPVHIGHLRLALELAELLSSPVDLMPCYGAVHKDGVSASPQQRLEMLRLAVRGEPLLGVDAREIARQRPSYTIDSLRELRAEQGGEPVNLVIGSDNLTQLPGWKDAQEYAGLCHLIVVHRPGFEVSDVLPEGFVRAPLDELNASPCGRICCVPIRGLDVASTQVRQCLAAGRSIRYLVTDAVHGYICDNALYFVPSAL